MKYSWFVLPLSLFYLRAFWKELFTLMPLQITKINMRILRKWESEALFIFLCILYTLHVCVRVSWKENISSFVYSILRCKGFKCLEIFKQQKKLLCDACWVSSVHERVRENGIVRNICDIDVILSFEITSQKNASNERDIEFFYKFLMFSFGTYCKKLSIFCLTQ
jgi:hypothetical protein